MTPFSSHKINKTLDSLCTLGLIPSEGTFSITEDLLNKYIRVYKSLNSNSTKDFDWWYARKVAGTVLLKLKRYRGESHKTINEGIIYAISNPAWNNYLKIGISIDTKKRLSTYQTGDPFRAYKIDGYEFVSNKRATEKAILDIFKSDLTLGEWLPLNNAREVLDWVKEDIKLNIRLCENINKPFGLNTL